METQMLSESLDTALLDKNAKLSQFSDSVAAAACQGASLSLLKVHCDLQTGFSSKTHKNKDFYNKGTGW